MLGMLSLRQSKTIHNSAWHCNRKGNILSVRNIDQCIVGRAYSSSPMEGCHFLHSRRRDLELIIQLPDGLLQACLGQLLMESFTAFEPVPVNLSILPCLAGLWYIHAATYRTCRCAWQFLLVGHWAPSHLVTTSIFQSILQKCCI